MRLKHTLMTAMGLCLWFAAWADLGAAPWTNDPLPPGIGVRAVHITELRTRINAKRQSCGLSQAAWTDTITAGATPIRKVHIDELRSAISGLYPAASKPSFTDSSTTAGVTRVRAVHISELRRALDLAVCCVPNPAICSAAAPACGKTTTGVNNCGGACTKTGPACCVPTTCSAAAPACGETTTGVDNCGGACTKKGPVCVCVSNPATCSAAAPACGKTTTGVDNCGKACSKRGPVCSPCNLPWGGTLASGQTVTAYKDSVVCKLNCVSETRQCANGVLSGSYAKYKCEKKCYCSGGGGVKADASGSGNVNETCLSWLERTGQWKAGGSCPSTSIQGSSCLFAGPEGGCRAWPVQTYIGGQYIPSAVDKWYPTSRCESKVTKGLYYNTYIYK